MIGRLARAGVLALPQALIEGCASFTVSAIGEGRRGTLAARGANDTDDEDLATACCPASSAAAVAAGDERAHESRCAARAGRPAGLAGCSDVQKCTGSLKASSRT